MKVAATVLAAEAWFIANDPVTIALALENELSAARWFNDRTADAQWAEATQRVVNIATARRTCPWESRSRQVAS